MQRRQDANQVRVRALIKVRAWRLVIVRAAVAFPLAVSVIVTVARDSSSPFGLTFVQEGYLVEPAGRLYLSHWNFK